MDIFALPWGDCGKCYNSIFQRYKGWEIIQMPKGNNFEEQNINIVNSPERKNNKIENHLEKHNYNIDSIMS